MRCDISCRSTTTPDSNSLSSTVVRTPQKLLDLLAARGVSSAKIEKHLVVLQGNALGVEAVKEVFTVDVSLVIFGIGQFSCRLLCRELKLILPRPYLQVAPLPSLPIPFASSSRSTSPISVETQCPPSSSPSRARLNAPLSPASPPPVFAPKLATSPFSWSLSTTGCSLFLTGTSRRWRMFYSSQEGSG